MALSTELVYNGYDNTIKLQLQVDGVVIADHTTITRAVLELGKGNTLLSPAPYQTIDSDIDPGYFDFTDATKLIIKLGAAALPSGRHNAELAIFMPGYTGGLSFGSTLDVRVQ